MVFCGLGLNTSYICTMKNVQNTVILILLLGLVGLTIYDRVGTKPEPIVESVRYESEVFNIELPEKLDFCGEMVPLKELEVREKLDNDLHRNTYFHSNTILILKRANRWFPRMRKILAEQGIPEDFVYLSVVESGLSNVVSPKGATGFWQFMKPTAREMGLTVNSEVDERYDPIKSTKAACKYLKQAYKKFENWTLVAASYNMGMRGVEKQMERQHADSYYDMHLNSETARYIYRILAFKEIMTNPQKYNFKIKPKHLYPAEKVSFIEVTEDIEDLAEFALVNDISYKNLKFYNPWLRKNSLDVKKGQKYFIAIPLDNEEITDDGDGLKEVKLDSNGQEVKGE